MYIKLPMDYDLSGPKCNVFDAGKSITWASERGLGPLPLALENGTARIKKHVQGRIKHRSINSYNHAGCNLPVS
jgi:hypothetical protein